MLGIACFGAAVLLWAGNWLLPVNNNIATNTTQIANADSGKIPSESTPGVPSESQANQESNLPTSENSSVVLEQANAILEQAKRAELKVAQATYANQMRIAFDCWKERDVFRAKEILNNLIPKDGAPEVRGGEWSYLYQLLDRPHRSLRFLGLEPQCVRYSPDGRLIAIGGPLMVQVVDAQTLNTAYVIPTLDAESRALAFSPDGKLLAATGHNGFVYVWNTATRKIVQKWATNQETGWGIAFSADGQYVIAESADAITRVWSVTSGELIREIPDAGGFRSALAVSSDGKFVATSRKVSDGSYGLGIWEMSTGRWLWRENSESVRGLDLTTDNRFMAAAQGENISMFELTDVTQSPRRLWTQRNWKGTRSLRISQDKRHLVAASDQGELHLYYLTPEWWADPAKLPQSWTWMGHDGSARSIDLSPDGNTIVSSGVDGLVRVWSMADIAMTPKPSSAVYRGFTGDAVFMPPEWKTSGKLSADGLLVVADGDGIKIWDPVTQEVREWIHQNGKATQPHARYAIAVAKSGRIVTVRNDDTIEIWDRDTSTDHLQQPGWTIPNVGGPKLALSRDGKWLVVNDYANEQYLIFDLKSKAEPWSITGWGPGAARFLGTGSKVILVRNGRLDCWDVMLRESVVSYPTDVSQQGVFALSPSEELLAIALQNRNIVICETATGRVVQTLVGDEDKISALVFLADEQTLISHGSSLSGSRLKFRQIATGEILGTLAHVGFEPNECDLSPDGHTIMSRHARRRPTVEAPSLIELRPGFRKR